jgi:DNA-directed RNA polymerase sigma subunit (sigma70/sigma32)
MYSSIDKIVADNIKLVYHVAKTYRTMPCFEDLVQEGTIGLIKAAKRFNPSLGIDILTALKRR